MGVKGISSSATVLSEMLLDFSFPMCWQYEEVLTVLKCYFYGCEFFNPSGNQGQQVIVYVNSLSWKVDQSKDLRLKYSFYVSAFG